MIVPVYIPHLLSSTNKAQDQLNDCSTMKDKQSVVSCTIHFLPQYLNEHGQVTCYPGSVFEGIVKVKASASIKAHYIKLVFRGTERVNCRATGQEESDATNDGLLFGIRTRLWGLECNKKVPMDAWPTLEAGEHNFPFTCQMPMVNYPPTFRHPLSTTSLDMFVAVRTSKIEPLVCKATSICFRPTVETVPCFKRPQDFVKATYLNSHIIAKVSVPKLAYNICNRNQSIPVTVDFKSLQEDNLSERANRRLPISQLQFCIKRCFSMDYNTFSRDEETKVVEHSCTELPLSYPSSVTANLDLPTCQELFPVTLNYSQHLTIEYRLVVSAKVPFGPFSINKKLFDVPIIFGTLPEGVQAPQGLKSYLDVATRENNEGSLIDKPRFLRSLPDALPYEEFLPAYRKKDDELPDYSDALAYKK